MELKLDKIILHLPRKWQYEKIVELNNYKDCKFMEYNQFMQEFFPKEKPKEVNLLALKKSQIKKEIEVLTKIEIILLNETDNKIRPLYDSVSILEPVRKQIIQLENIYFLLEDIEK